MHFAPISCEVGGCYVDEEMKPTIVAVKGKQSFKLDKRFQTQSATTKGNLEAATSSVFQFKAIYGA